MKKNRPGAKRQIPAVSTASGRPRNTMKSSGGKAVAAGMGPCHGKTRTVKFQLLPSVRVPARYQTERMNLGHDGGIVVEVSAPSLQAVLGTLEAVLAKDFSDPRTRAPRCRHKHIPALDVAVKMREAGRRVSPLLCQEGFALCPVDRGGPGLDHLVPIEQPCRDILSVF